MDTTIQNTHSSYAGFGKRLLAYLIDVIIISVLWFILASILGALGFGGLSAMGGMENLEEPSGAALGLLAGGMMGMMFVGYLVQWLYFASMHSSARQATFGKSAMNLIVTDMDGGRISFGKASLRYLGKIISGMIMLIGFIMAAFTDKKQALHDMMASTLVVQK